jgi:hypothetical protein
VVMVTPCKIYITCIFTMILKKSIILKNHGEEWDRGVSEWQGG